MSANFTSLEEKLAALDKYSKENPGQPVSQLARQLFPEIELSTSIAELRRQVNYNGPTPKPKYPGRRSGVDPIAFLMEHYGDDIAAGLQGPFRLHETDQTLYLACNQALSRQTPPLTIGKFLSDHTAPENQGTPHQRRVKALATILDCDPVQAIKFLASMRTDRLSQYLKPAGDKGRS